MAKWLATMILILALALPIASCYWVQTGVEMALPSEDVWVYEECYDYADRITKCAPLDEPRVEKHTAFDADIWISLVALIATGWLTLRGWLWLVEKLDGTTDSTEGTRHSPCSRQ